MSWGSKFSFFQYKLGRKLTFRIVIFSSIVTFILTVIQFGFEYHQLSKRLDEVPKFIDKTMTPAIAEAIWEDDKGQLKKLLQGINQLEFLDSSTLDLHKGESVTHVNRESNYSRVYDIDILREGNSLGSLSLVVSEDVVLLHMLNQIYIILLKNGFKTAFVVFFILVLFRSMVGQHLMKMINYMASYSASKAGELEKGLRLDRKKTEAPDELDDLVLAFNELNARIQLESKKRADTESQIIHLERIGTMGELATSLAHELNQPLSGILGYSDIATRLVNRIESPEKHKQERDDQAGVRLELTRCLNKIGDEAERAAGIIKRTREFVKRDSSNAERVDLLSVVKDSIALIEHRGLSHGVSFCCSAEFSVYVKLDKVQLQQVLVNLFNNAIQALSDLDDGRVIVSIKRLEDQVQLTVSDNGPGIDEDVKAHLFEAFRTTKEDGLGLGLVICRNIIEASQGNLGAQNNEQGGADFILTLPIASQH